MNNYQVAAYCAVILGFAGFYVYLVVTQKDDQPSSKQSDL